MINRKTYTFAKASISFILAAALMAASVVVMMPPQQAAAAGSTVATSSSPQSPQKTDNYEGEKRLFSINGILFAFYFDGSNIVYKKSSDNANSWSSATSTGSGTVASDNTRWTIVRSLVSGKEYVAVLYWQVSGSNHNFYAIRGTINTTSATISWTSPILLGYTQAHTDCAGGACAAAVAAADTSGTIFAAFRYKPGGQSNYYFAIKYSTDGGQNWYDSWSHSDIGSTYPPTMTLTELAAGKMLWAYAFYNINVLNYKVYVPGEGWYSYSTTITGWPTAGNKQLSSASDSTGKAFVAYVSSGTTGDLKVARFSNTGTFEALETADNTLSHSLPSIVITNDDVIHIYSLAGSTTKVYETKKVNNVWQTPSTTFGSSFTSPNMLTAAISYRQHYTEVAMWTESSAPYSIQLGVTLQGVIGQISTSISPSKTDSYEGERRLVNISDTHFVFYYDGSNIVYKKSTDDGETWSSPISTGSGTLASDTYRWSLWYTTISGTNYISLLYWIPAGTNMNFTALRGTVSGSSITWSSPIHLGYTTAHSDCGTGGACAAVVMSSDTSGTLWAVWRYLPGGQSNYYFAIKYSNDGGLTWWDSWSHSSIGSTYPPTMALTKLSSGKMLWAYSFYNTNILYYKVYTPGVGWNSYSTTITGWPTAGNKQLSADSNSTGNAFVAYVSGGTSGTFKLARFSNAGVFEALETVDSTGSHSLPSVTVNPDDLVLLYSLSGGKVTHLKRLGDDRYTQTSAPYGDAFNSPDQLTAGVWYAGSVWREGTSAPFTLRYNGIYLPILLSNCSGGFATPTNPCSGPALGGFAFSYTTPTSGYTTTPCPSGPSKCFFGTLELISPDTLGFGWGSDRTRGVLTWTSEDPLHGPPHFGADVFGDEPAASIFLEEVNARVPVVHTAIIEYRGGLTPQDVVWIITIPGYDGPPGP